MNKFGQILIQKRKEKGLSQRELSDISKVGSVQICLYEKGKVVPTKKIVSKIADALNLPEDYFDNYLHDSPNSLSTESLKDDIDAFMRLTPSNNDKIVLKRMIQFLMQNYNRDLTGKLQ